MATVESRAQRGFRRTDLPDPIYWLWRRLTSVRFALILIGLVAFFAFVAVIIPQVPPQLAGTRVRIDQHVDAQRGTWGPVTDVLAEFPWFYDAQGGVFNLFSQPYWYALVTLLALSITVCAVSRFPPIWRTLHRPQVRVGDKYFERARHRFDFATPTDPAALAAVLRRHRFRVHGKERDGALYLFADRFQWVQLATFVSHLALIMLVLGSLLTKWGGEEFQFWLAEGQSRPLFATAGDREQIQIVADDVIAKFDENGRALDFRSTIRVASGGQVVAAGDVTVNGPLSGAGYRVHQAAFWENGAALEIRDAQSGQVLYSEALFLSDRFDGPRVHITDEESGAPIAEEVVQLPQSLGDIPGSGYQVIPLGGDRSLALALIPDADGVLQFYYAVVPLALNRLPAQLDSAALHFAQPQPIAPHIRIYDATTARLLGDEVIALTERPIQGEESALLGFIPLSETETLAVGFDLTNGPRRFFYFDLADASQRGLLEPGGRATLGAVQLEYVGEAVDRSQYGSLQPGEEQRIGSILLTYGGTEPVFYTIAPELPGAQDNALVLMERFGRQSIAETFDARGGENVALTQGSATPAGSGVAGRPARLGIGLGGAQPRFDLSEGESRTVGDYTYTFLGPREFTGLNVRRDPGALIFWIAIGLGVAALAVTFFVPRRRIWAKITPERTYLAGLAGHAVNLRQEMARYARETGASVAAPAADDWSDE